jgi:hypothetical protein
VKTVGSRSLWLAPLLMLAWSMPAGAEGRDRLGPVTHDATRKECGECHMAFLPGLLPAASWRQVMSGLSRHFGEDASLDAAKAADIERYLVAHAGAGDGALSRITEQRWFVREHRRITAATWARPDIKAKSNCAGCHPAAERGLYEDE